MILPILKRTSIIVGALLVAFLAIGLAASLLMGVVYGYQAHGLSIALWDEVFGKFLNTLVFSGVIAFAATLMTGVPLLLVVVWAEAKRIRNPFAHLVVGFAFSVLFSPALAMSERGNLSQALETLALFASSACIGALTYWPLAGRNAGRWQDRSL